MNIAVTGASGLVGTAFCDWARQAGHTIVRLVRTPTQPSDIRWHSSQSFKSLDPFLGVQCFVHLAGAPIAASRWSEQVKKEILDSRVEGTRNIAALIAQLPQKPMLLQISAIGYYGDTGDEPVDEHAAAGHSFLAEVCTAWEQEAQPVAEAGCVLHILRLGVVLAAQGGALRKMLPAFRAGVAGRVGSGQQYMSWIALDDVVRAFAFFLEQSRASVANLVAPEAVRNREFTKTLGAVLHRPTVIPLPAGLARFAMGEMADELLLVSARVHPSTLLERGFSFNYPALEPALRNILSRD